MSLVDIMLELFIFEHSKSTCCFLGGSPNQAIPSSASASISVEAKYRILNGILFSACVALA